LRQIARAVRHWSGAGNLLEDMVNVAGARAVTTTTKGRSVYELNCPTCHPRGGGPRKTQRDITEMLDALGKHPGGAADFDISTMRLIT
jgi:hypothetical protein